MSMASGMIANAVGGELQGWAALLDQWNMQDAYQAQANYQQGQAKKALGVFNQNLPAFSAGAANTAITNDTANRMQLYNNADAVPLSATPAKASGFAPASLNVTNRASAGLGAYGDWQFDLSQNQINQQRLLNQIVNFSKGQAGVFPYQMYQAQHSNDDLAAVGQAISSLGGGSTNYGSLFASSPTTSGAGGSGFSSFGSGGGLGQGGVDTDGSSFDVSGFA